MKKLILLTGMLLLVFMVKAQDQMFFKNDKNVNIGFGFLNHPVISASLDYGIAEDVIDYGAFGIGPYAGLGFSSSDSYLSAGARGTFHYPLIEKLDTYLGVSFGMEYRFESAAKMAWYPGVFIGANYPLNDEVTLFGEMGSGVTYLQFGITLGI
ncbi:MAG TPA: hypothetical protein VJ909_03605 [Prolixibacteraceae bacterium]|nr:hypothetical protein [Prolixibacteraceae bacterium]